MPRWTTGRPRCRWWWLPASSTALVRAVTGLPRARCCWVCVRPSGTEPKIKLYVNANDPDRDAANALNAKLCEASKALMA